MRNGTFRARYERGDVFVRHYGRYAVTGGRP